MKDPLWTVLRQQSVVNLWELPVDSRDVVSVSTSRSWDVVSKRLGLVSVSWKRGKVSVLISSQTENQMSRSHTIGSRLQANMHNFLLHCKTAPTSFLVTWTHVHVCYMLSPVRLSSVCVKRSCTLLRRLKFSQYFYGMWYLGHPLTSTKNFTEIVPAKPLFGGS